jgi:hypothetical protein
MLGLANALIKRAHNTKKKFFKFLLSYCCYGYMKRFGENPIEKKIILREKCRIAT